MEGEVKIWAALAVSTFSHILKRLQKIAELMRGNVTITTATDLNYPGFKVHPLKGIRLSVTLQRGSAQVILGQYSSRIIYTNIDGWQQEEVFIHSVEMSEVDKAFDVALRRIMLADNPSIVSELEDGEEYDEDLLTLPASRNIFSLSSENKRIA